VIRQLPPRRRPAGARWSHRRRFRQRPGTAIAVRLPPRHRHHRRPADRATATFAQQRELPEREAPHTRLAAAL